MTTDSDKTGAPRATSSATITFGMVAIPVKLYTSAMSENVSFNMLHNKCHGRLKQQYICPADDVVVGKEDTVKGYEHAKGQYVVFTEEEVKALEAEKSKVIDIVEFVPLDTVDFLFVQKSHYLGPDKGGDKSYKLLATAMHNKGVVAVGRWAARGKEELVIVRPYEGGIVLHQLYYANEVRPFHNTSTVKFTIGQNELDLAGKLIEQLSSERFAPGKYRDEYVDRVMAVVEKKIAGEEVVIAPAQATASILDLAEALKRSLNAAPAKPEPATLPAKKATGKPAKKKTA